MSTIKSSAENLTLNADGANNDIIFQSNGSNVATLDQAGLLTATTFAGSGASLTALPAANITGTLPAIDGSNLTGLSSFNPDGAVTINDAGADVDFRVESDARTHMLTVDGANNVVGISHGGFMGDLGQGLHIKTTDTGGDAHVSADELVIEHNNNAGITILSANAGVSDGNIFFGDAQDNDIGKIVYNHNDDHMEFFTNTAKQLQLESNGDVSVKTGDIVFTTAGKGICLGVTSNTAANTLDDYEEGTWTPIFAASSSYSGQSYGVQQGSYTKVGRLVTCTCYLTLSTEGSFAGTLFMGGFPFNQGGAGGYAAGIISRVEQWQIGTNHTLCFHMNTNTGTFTTYTGAGSANGHTTLTADGALTNITSIIMTVVYMT